MPTFADMSIMLISLMSGLGPLALLVLVAAIFVETGLLVGFFLPGDSLLFAAGLLVASHALPVPLAGVVGAVWVAGVLGDQVAYWLGKRLGPRLLGDRRPRWVSAKHVLAAQGFFGRHGHKAVILARFVPLVRTFTPVVAGAVGMSRRRFTGFNVVGGLAWVVSMCLAGYFLGGVPLIAHHVDLVVVGMIAFSLVPAAVSLLRRRRARRARPAETPAPEPERELSRSC